MKLPAGAKKGATRKGHVIVLEGPDGVGKSTIAAQVEKRLRASGVKSRLQSFPGREDGTLGRLVYGIHHDPRKHGIENLSATAKQALHVAAHIDLIEREIAPALADGMTIVLDRFWWSTVVYGLASGIERDVLDCLLAPELNLWRGHSVTVFLLDRDAPIDRDDKPASWQKLRKLYGELAKERPDAVVRIENRRTTGDAVDAILSEATRRKIVKVAVGKQADRAAQLTIAFTASELDIDRRSNGPMVHTRIAPAVPTIVLDSYWRFAAERQEVFFKRLAGERGPWTCDPIIDAHKFTNAYRASDRVSQYLIRHVIYRDDLPDDATEMFFRVLLFKLFNKIETWQLLERKFGAITYKDYKFRHYDQVLSKALSDGRRIYSAAYIMPPGGTAFGEKLKHQNHLRLLERMMTDEVPARLGGLTRMQDAFELLLSYPTIGDFLAYQFVTDINYSTVTDFSEMEFVMPGPGALDGIRKCFASLGGLNEPEIIRLMADIQEDEFERLGLKFRSLFGRRLQLIDCQNLFCETDKYARVAHPEFMGRTGRTRIKQKFSPTAEPIAFWYPPKWEINEAIERVHGQTGKKTVVGRPVVPERRR